ncbi:UNVERIFIED_CONTAM: hypothetical protein Sradi_1769400 [Sesamum radiatum]|uniref:Uncharacterized protein n=1 Tax=Sesamum radiatum TaxID=300843 RepID=A0AAW2TTX2_SESRA
MLADWGGQSATIACEPWLPRPHTFQLIAKPRTLHCEAKVAALIDAERGWNKVLIGEEFLPIDADCILSIPLPEDDRRDEIVWHYGKKGLFSVRSAYELAVSLPSASSSKTPDADWTGVFYGEPKYLRRLSSSRSDVE